MNIYAWLILAACVIAIAITIYMALRAKPKTVINPADGTDWPRHENCRSIAVETLPLVAPKAKRKSAALKPTPKKAVVKPAKKAARKK